MEPSITGAATLTKVTISSLALLKIVQHGTRSLPELCAGCLLGLDDGNGGLDVSDCFAYPSSSSVQGVSEEDDDIGKNESDAAEFREDMLKLLKDSDCNMDDFCVGWYRTVNMGDWCNINLVEQQFEHQEDCDLGTGLAKSCLIVYDPYQSEKGVLAIKALRLTDAFMEVMRVRANSDARSALASDFALSRFRMSDIFYEIPVEFNNSSTLSRIALSNLSLGRARTPVSLEFSGTGLDRLVISTDPYLEKNIAFTIEELDSLHEEQQKGAQHQKALARQKQQQDAWIAQRKQENLLREERGEEPLPLKDPSNPMFKVLRDSSKFGSLLLRKQVDIYCDQVNEWSAQSFEKLFLLGSVQQQQIGHLSSASSM